MKPGIHHISILAAAACAAVTLACSEPVPLDVNITEEGKAEDVLGVKALTGDGTVHLQWTLPAGMKGVSIRRSTTAPPFSVVDGEGIYSGPATSFVDTDVFNDGTRYYYLVVAIDQNLNFAGGVNVTSRAFDYGKVYVRPSDTTSKYYYSVKIDNGSIYLAGSVDDSGSNQKWFIEKRSADTGILDTSFDGDGVVISDPSDTTDNLNSMYVDNGYIYAGGVDCSPGNSQWRIEKRSAATGALVTDFDDDGIVTSNYNSNGEQINSIVVDSGYIYAGGYIIETTKAVWRIEKRSAASGQLDADFGVSGVVTGVENAQIISMAVNPGYLYVAGIDQIDVDAGWRIEKRSASTGLLDTSFDGDGVIVSNPSSRYDGISSIVIDNEYMYVAGGDMYSGVNDYQMRIEKRSTGTGLFDASFDGDGVVVSNLSSGADYISSLVINTPYMYAVGCEYPDNKQKWRLEKRNVTSGELVFSFTDTQTPDGGALTSVDAADGFIVVTGDMNMPPDITTISKCYFIGFINDTTGTWRTGPLVEVP